MTIFDATLGGAGGCPFIPKATGNVATEDVAFSGADGRHYRHRLATPVASRSKSKPNSTTSSRRRRSCSGGCLMARSAATNRYDDPAGVRILNPFADSRPLWLASKRASGGRCSGSSIRRPWGRPIYRRLTIFEPESSALRTAIPNRKSSTSSGSGLAIDVTLGIESSFRRTTDLHPGHVHIHRNTGHEPLWLLWCYAPPGEADTLRRTA